MDEDNTVSENCVAPFGETDKKLQLFISSLITQ